MNKLINDRPIIFASDGDRHMCKEAVMAQDDGVISIDSDLVVLNALIRDTNGRSRFRPEKELFSVLENGVEQPISYFSLKKHLLPQ